MANTQTITRMMRALQYDPSDRKVYINEVDVPEPKNTEILDKIRCASLCHSGCLIFHPDFNIRKGLKSPPTLGHEATGIVVQSGNQVTNLEKGESVGFLASCGCFDCVDFLAAISGHF